MLGVKMTELQQLKEALKVLRGQREEIISEGSGTYNMFSETFSKLLVSLVGMWEVSGNFSTVQKYWALVKPTILKKIKNPTDKETLTKDGGAFDDLDELLGDVRFFKLVAAAVPAKKQAVVKKYIADNSDQLDGLNYVMNGAISDKNGPAVKQVIKAIK